MHQFSSVAVVDTHGRVLMQERDEHAPVHPGTWGLPGGALEHGESFAAAAVRELEEETTLRVPAESLTSLGRTRFHSDPCGHEDEFELFVVRADVDDSDITCREGRQMVFVEQVTLFDRPLMPASRMQLPDVLESPSYRHSFGGVPGRRFASVLLVDRAGAILMQERDEHPLLDPECWGLPGGHLERAESFTEAAARELAEETGVVIDPAALTLVGEVRVDHRDVHGSHDRLRLFAAATSLGDTDIECREGRQMVFVDPCRALGLPLTRSAAVALPRFLESDLYARLRS